MAKWLEKVVDLNQSRENIAQRPYGMIQATGGEFDFVQLRPWPKLISVAEANWIGGWKHGRLRRDQAHLYYNQPWMHGNFLSLKYVVTAWGTSLATIRTALRTLDKVAQIKGSDAILCEITNRRISDQILRYAGFERHLPHSRKRHYIRRFYGQYPAHTRLAGMVIAETDAVESPDESSVPAREAIPFKA